MRRTDARRRFVATAVALAATPALSGRAAAQSAPAPDGAAFEDALRAIVAGRVPRAGGIEIEMPALSENGNAVDLTVRVDSPMSVDDHVRAIHVLSPRNPSAMVASFRLTPRSGRAQVSTRIRLATTQRILVLAETSAGALLSAEREVIVVLGACVDGG
jgi:sulfur-oxidizing protein SoxY